MGILGGYQRLKTISIWKMISCSLLVLSNLVTLRLMNHHGLTLVYNATSYVAVSALNAILGVVLVHYMPPDALADEVNVISIPNFCLWRKKTRTEAEALENEQLLLDGQGIPSYDSGGDASYDSGGDASYVEHNDNSDWKAVKTELMNGALNMMTRSFLLSGSIWLMSLLASRLGTAQLAAHQIVLTLWSIASYLADGFADVGTMLGAKFISSGETEILRSVFHRLLALGLFSGVAFSIVFFLLSSEIESVFTNNTETKKALASIWPLVAAMQIVNSLVFVYDGLIYATASWSYVRNVMLIGCLLWFIPSVFVATSLFRSLLSIWVAKAGLNVFRFVAAAYLIEFHTLQRSP
mmetsp:Transcript_9522/g.12442  ORF Transcript_9522/g.12442 Transcript_9522/m.12442 type:complete len:352 (+) Transcript_9522:326-1381(+)